MSGRRVTQRQKVASASEGAGGASLAAAGSLVTSRGMAELYAALSAGNLDWGRIADLNIDIIEREGLGAALLAARAPPAPKKLSRKEYKALYAQQAAEAAARRATRSPGRARTPSSEVRRRRETMKKTTKGRH